MAGSQLLVFIATVLFSMAHANNVKYFVAAPDTIRPGLPFEVSASITADIVQGVTEISVRIEDNRKQIIVQTEAVQFNPGDAKFISMMIPETATGYTFTLFVKATGAVSFEESRNLMFKAKSHISLIQTDKAKYKPGDTVKFRCLTLDPALKATIADMLIEITDPGSSKIMSEKVSADQLDLGVYSGEMLLSSQPVLGTYRISLNSAGASNSINFKVEEYVLPKYEVKLEMPSHYVIMDGNIEIKVIATYTHGGPVKGFVSLMYSLDGSTKTVRGDLDSQGMYKLTLTPGLLGPMCRYMCSANSDKELIRINWNHNAMSVTANVTEKLTMINSTKTGSIQFKDRPFTVSFIGPTNFKAGLVYFGMIKITGPDGGFPKHLLAANGELKKEYKDKGMYINVTHRYTRTTVNEQGVTEETPGKMETAIKVEIDPSGEMVFELEPGPTAGEGTAVRDVFTSINLHIEWNGTYANKDLSRFKTRDDFSLLVTLPDVEGEITEDKFKVQVQSTVPLTSIYYIIVSKGRVISVEHVPLSGVLGHNFMYEMTERAKLAPSARILVYTISADGEIIVDSVSFDVAGVFTNEVTTKFDRAKAQPGEDIDLRITADPNSFVAILAVDMSTTLNGGSNDLTVSQIEAELSGFNTGTAENYNGGFGGGGFCPMCRRRRRKRSIWLPRWTPGSDAQQLFKNAGMVVITDAYVNDESSMIMPPVAMMPAPGIPGIPQAMPEAMPGIPEAMPDVDDRADSLIPIESQPEPERIRTDFPETWLWSDVTLGPNGEMRYSTKVPDTMTTWIASAFAVSAVNGFGINEEPATVEVSKDFFVQINLPYSVIRGEEVSLQTLIFNYVEEAVDVTFTLRANDGFVVKGKTGDFVQKLQVGPNDSADVRTWIVPRRLGEIELDVEASAGRLMDRVIRKLLVEPEGKEENWSKGEVVTLNADNNNKAVIIFNPDFPDNVVEGSEFVTVSFIGDLMGPSLSGLEKLVRQPTGCGEQNMITLVPNIYAIDYIDAVGQNDQALRTKAIGFMKDGYQRELNYKHEDHSFSAFGTSDASGSTWLTAFVISSFKHASEYITVDNTQLANSLNWLSRQMDTSGKCSEPEGGRVIHADMQGGTGEGVGLSAYCAMTFLENKDMPDYERSWRTKVEASVNYLASKLESLKDEGDPMPVALITYVLHLADHNMKDAAYDILMNMATNENGQIHWEKVKDEEDKEDEPIPFYLRKMNSDSSSVEMTGYALLIMAHRVKNNMVGMDITDGLPVVKWLASNRNSLGGYCSTQDTVVALRGLAAYASMIQGGETNMQCTVEANNFSEDFVAITSDNSLVLQTMEIPSAVAKQGVLNVACKGSGTGLVQMNIKNNVHKSIPRPSVEVKVKSRADIITRVVTTAICASWKKKKNSGMVVLDMTLPSGYEAKTENMMQKYKSKGLKRLDAESKKLVMYLDQLTSDDLCIDVEAQQTAEVRNIQYANIEAFSYYTPQYATVVQYKPDGIDDIGKETDGGGKASHGNTVSVSLASVLLSLVMAILHF